MDNVSRNIARLMRQLELSQRALAKKAGISQPTLHKILSGKTENSRYLVSIASVLGCTVEDLHKDPTTYLALPKSSEALYVRERDDATSLYRGITEDEFIQVPVRKDVHLSAGAGYYVEDETIAETVPVSSNRLRELGVEPARAEIVNVRGESMWPNFMDGDQVLVNTGRNRPQDGKVYAFEFEGDTKIKRFGRRLDGTWRIISDNDDKNLYPDEILANHNMDRIRIIGEVVALTYRRI